jgi:hypothetical protein
MALSGRGPFFDYNYFIFFFEKRCYRENFRPFLRCDLHVLVVILLKTLSLQKRRNLGFSLHKVLILQGVSRFLFHAYRKTEGIGLTTDGNI